MPLDPTFDPRIAGQVNRYHSWPRLREQSVGEHTWQAIRIMITVWPDCPRKLIIHAMLHDVGEMYGDIQWPWKQKVPELGVGAKKAEAMVHQNMTELWELPPPVVLSAWEHRVFKACENLEMWEWAVYEFHLGNQYARIVAERMMGAVGADLEAIINPPNGYPDLRPAFMRYISKRSATT